MKHHILFATILSLFFLCGCFEDEGTYTYEPFNGPLWVDENGVISIETRVGETAKFYASPSFTWEGDSAQRASEVTYEWSIQDKVIAKELDFEIAADSLVKVLGITKINGEAMAGNFKVIEKETGISFIKSVVLYVEASRTSGDWYIVSENGMNTKLSFLKQVTTPEGKRSYELEEDIYPVMNEEEIVGKPLFVSHAEGATNVGIMGSLSIVTTEGMYEINCDNVLKVGEMEKLPFPGNMVIRYDSYPTYSEGSDDGVGLQTFVTDSEGKLYRRMMTKNNLAGVFGSTPLVSPDNKGYNISKIGQTMYGFTVIPCWDQANNRLLTISFYESGAQEFEEWFPGSGMGSWVPAGEQFTLSKLMALDPPHGSNITNCAPVWNMPEGTKPLYLYYAGYQGNPFTGQQDRVAMIYNDAAGDTWWTEILLDANTSGLKNGKFLKQFPAGNLADDALLLGCNNNGAQANYLLYTMGNQIRFVNTTNDTDNAFITLEETDDKVTYMAWDSFSTYQYLMVGTEKGNAIVYYLPYGEPLKANPRVVKKFNVGGKVVSMKELFSNVTGYRDKY